MKRHLLFLFFLVNNICFAQVDKYEELIAQAGLFHLQKEHRKAIEKFEEALSIKRLDALNSYKLAGAYSLARNSDKAFYYLNQAIEIGFTEADLLAIDSYFDTLKDNFSEKWKQLELKAREKEKQYEKTLKLPELRRKINSMTFEDQKLRLKRIQTTNSEEIQLLNQQINISDLRNLNEARKIIKQNGWPKISDVGRDGQNNFWLVVQHADQDVRFQKWALSEMEKHLKTNEIDLENYAFLHDRVQCNLNYKQLYGTQVIWTQNGMASNFRPILKENLVDKRRKSLKLLPLKIYALTYGFNYKEISSKQAKVNDDRDLELTKQLIDSAKTSYKAKEFQKTYDYYNTASAIMGGMNEQQNYEAAILFAKIYNSTNEEQYRSISLDFLTLQYYREKLKHKKLMSQKEFKSFYNQERWIEIVKNL